MRLLALLATAGVGAAQVIGQTVLGGSLSLVTNDPPFEFQYSTPSAKPRNWIGIYRASGGGPDNEKHVSDSLAWGYAPDGHGKVRIPVPNLPAGDYKAYFLQDDGYKWVANPITVKHPGTPFQFIVSDFTTANVWQGQQLKASVGGLLANPPDGKTKFVKADSTRDVDWIQVSPDGTLSGTPDTSPGSKKLTVEAIASNGARARLRVVVPVVNSKSPLVEKLSVMSYNLWFDGTRVNDYHNKQVRFISNSGADLVGLQESGAGSATRLAKALGWEHWQGSVVSILSRYPILEVYQPAAKGGAVRVSLGKKQVVMWNTHLGYDPYGPYDFCFDHMTREQVFEREKQSGRTPQIMEIMQRMKGVIGNADQVPVLLTGDFNAPSHLDWNEKTKHLHCNIGDVAWPTSKYPTDAGLIDSYRAIHKDPLAKPGITWSPIFLDNNGRPEPLDRIDFIYHKGLTVLESETQVVGKPRPQPYERNNEWTSDHAAVKTIFQVHT
ncbi:hypothetical protein HIM_06783 [Hirsutella minnesotensis 3608]|uniref:Endonuclease/exonuclease/phosphatase domain-containing protein n=1 Tax=Hirsutella minnesotensis 3608 TaxID=1043627 RepID=A0A0F7ZNK1_9HYPO|nr:hypothetical protein HIM_06783 [Hirsutella minnesotensis 3608]